MRPPRLLSTALSAAATLAGRGFPRNVGATVSQGGTLLARAARSVRPATQGWTVADVPSVAEPEFARLVEALTDAPVTHGNRVRVLRNGDEIFPAMLEAIRSAERTVDFATYVYWTGSIADEVVEALCERSTAGVEVNVLLDAVGAAKMERQLVQRLRDCGATVSWFRPPWPGSVHKLDHRTHRKILVVDGSVGFTGGVGIAQEWTGDAQDPDHWRDTHVRVEGPAVRGLLGGFQDNWSEATRTILTGAHLPELKEHPDGVQAQVTRSSATHGSAEAEELFHVAMAAARERLWMTTAYFAPRPSVVQALTEAAARGVDVRVLTNGPHIDKQVVRQAGRRTYDELLAGGVRVYEYQRTMLHAKVLTVDRCWSTLGSINVDNRSFALNDELNISFSDAGIATELEEHFLADLTDALEIVPGRWVGRSPLARGKEIVAGALRREL
jgi:cardiolipin synthase